MQKIRFLLLGIIYPFVASYIAFTGFVSNYTLETFSYEGFISQYSSGIYKYRVLGQKLMLLLYNLIQRFPIIKIQARALETAAQPVDFSLYSAYFYLNAISLCVAGALLFTLISRNQKDHFQADLTHLFLITIIAFSEFVVTPYDILSYTLILAILAVMTQKTAMQLPLSCLLVMLLTLTRESAVLALCIWVSLHWPQIRNSLITKKYSQEIGSLLILVVVFASTYTSLRIFYGTDQAVSNGVITLQWRGIRTYLGLLFLLSVHGTLVLSSWQHSSVRIFTVSSLPFLLANLLVGITWEIRLWIPFILIVTILKLLENTNSAAKNIGGNMKPES